MNNKRHNVKIGSYINNKAVINNSNIISENILIKAIMIKVKLLASESMFFVKKEELVFI